MGAGAINCCDVSISRANEMIIPTEKKLSLTEKKKLLKLDVISNGEIPLGTQYFIDYQGYGKSKRVNKDGLVYFGCKSTADIQNDIDIGFGADGNRDAERNFVICYKNETESYWIQDLGRGFGAFLKLDFALVLKNDMLINIGGNFLITGIKAYPNKAPRLKLKQFSEKVTGEAK